MMLNWYPSRYAKHGDAVHPLFELFEILKGGHSAPQPNAGLVIKHHFVHRKMIRQRFSSVLEGLVTRALKKMSVKTFKIAKIFLVSLPSNDI